METACTLGQAGNGLADTVAKSSAELGLILGVTKEGIDERASVIENHAIGPADQLKESDKVLRRLRQGKDVLRLVGSLDAFLDCGCEAADGCLQFRVIVHWALHGVNEEQAAALEFSEGGFFLEIGAWRNGETLHHFVEKHARADGPHRAVLRRAIKEILKAGRRGGVNKKYANVERAEARCEFQSLDALADVQIIDLRVATVAERHAFSFAVQQWFTPARRNK
jgi:hypothetical protein